MLLSPCRLTRLTLLPQLLSLLLLIRRILPPWVPKKYDVLARRKQKVTPGKVRPAMMTMGKSLQSIMWSWSDQRTK